jgi:hypothetical protein
VSTVSDHSSRPRPQTSPSYVWWGKRAEKAERLKLEAHIEALRERAKRFSHETDGGTQALVRRLLNENDWCMGEKETLHTYADKLEELLPLIADDRHLRTELTSELAGGDPEENIKLATVFDDATLERLRKIVTEYDTAPPDSHRSDNKDYVAGILSLLYKERANRLRHERLMAGLRPTYLKYQIWLIIGLLALFFLAILIGNPTDDGAIDLWARFIVVTTAGALGSVLAASLKLRDIADLNPFRGVAATTWIQPVIGASIGLISWLILASGAVRFGEINNQAWQTQAVVAFASGLSEPLFFNIVGRVMGPR